MIPLHMSYGYVFNRGLIIHVRVDKGRRSIGFVLVGMQLISILLSLFKMMSALIVSLALFKVLPVSDFKALFIVLSVHM